MILPFDSPILFCFGLFESRSWCVAQAGLELIPWLELSECCSYGKYHHTEVRV